MGGVEEPVSLLLRPLLVVFLGKKGLKMDNNSAENSEVCHKRSARKVRGQRTRPREGIGNKASLENVTKYKVFLKASLIHNPQFQKYKLTFCITFLKPIFLCYYGNNPC